MATRSSRTAAKWPRRSTQPCRGASPTCFRLRGGSAQADMRVLAPCARRAARRLLRARAAAAAPRARRAKQRPLRAALCVARPPTLCFVCITPSDSSLSSPPRSQSAQGGSAGAFPPPPPLPASAPERPHTTGSETRRALRPAPCPLRAGWSPASSPPACAPRPRTWCRARSCRSGRSRGRCVIRLWPWCATPAAAWTLPGPRSGAPWT